MNIPYLEHRVVSVLVAEDRLYWVELSKFGARVQVIGKGELNWGKTAEEHEQALTELKRAIKADTYQVTLTAPNILVYVLAEELPFFEDVEETNTWMESKRQELEEKANEKVQVSHHLVNVEEDVHRALFQVVDQEKTTELERIFLNADLPLTHVYSGITEYGYSHILNPEVVEGLHSVLVKAGKETLVVLYKEGALQHIHTIALHEEADSYGSYVISQAHSLIQSEELAQQVEQGISPLYLGETSAVHTGAKRKLETLIPFDGKQPFVDISEKYFGVLGAGIKSFYPELDQFECVSESGKQQARELSDKQSFKKVAVLLTVPIVLLFLGTYVWSSLVHYQLQETSQVMGAIEDKLSLVQQERAQVQRLFASYKDLKEITGQQTNVAKVFTALNETVSPELTLEKLDIVANPERLTAQIMITGIAQKETAISLFMKKLSAHPWMSAPQLVTSSTSKNGAGTEFTIAVEGLIE